MSVVGFYDGLAAEYHLIYRDWEEAVERQGRVLDRLIGDALGEGSRDVLDCACGIGTQAIGLAMRGHRVTGSDLSAAAIERARREAAAHGQDIRFSIADFRDLRGIDGSFDVVVNCDNALPHLEEPAEIDAALAAMAGRLRPGGLLIVSIRDYDAALAERPGFVSGLLDGPPRRVVSRLHDWEGEGPVHTVHILIATETEDGWRFGSHRTRYRALTRAELSGAATAAGLEAQTWLDGEALGFHQPLFTARAPAGG